ncbi:MAG: PAS domain S-box protein [Deltaproteobacteria bacterium]|nr:PAS domain S-box protein [Deltaproteobacteria bacterium]
MEIEDVSMSVKPSYEELEQRVKDLEWEAGDRKQVQDALRESEAIYRLLFSAEPDAIIIVDPRTKRIVDANTAALTLYGYSSDEFLRLRAIEISAEPEKSIAHIQEVASGMPTVVSSGPVQRLHKKKDCTIFPVEISSWVFLLQDRRMLCAIIRDITERKRAEEAIHESEEKYRSLFDESIDAIYITSREGKFLDANQAALELFGYAREELINNINIRKLYIHPGDRDKFQQEIEGKGSVRNYPIEFRKKNGTGMNCLLTSTSRVSSDGDILGYQGIIRDVTERKLAEEALRESEKKYSTLVENSLTGIYIDQDEKIVFANNRFAEIYRYPKGQLIGIETWRLVHPEDRSLTKQMRARRLSGEDAPSEYEARGQTKDGETIWITRRNARIEYKGRAAILGNIVDITEQKQAEAELRKTNEELKNFVDVVSHDLKTPVIAIHGFASRLIKHYQEKLGDKGSRQLEQIMASARRMELLVSDLLTLSRIGRIVPTFEHVASREIVRNVISGIQNRIKEKGIEVVVADNLPTIFCDGERIYQVFENLLVNATKFTADVKKPKIEIGHEDGEDLHLFYVRDNGIGIDPEYHLRIFDMFHRLRLKEDKEGTGLGLAIVDRIVKNHGGKVWVESEKGKGATFYFTVPKRS